MKLFYLLPVLLVGFLPTALGEIQQINNDDVKLNIQLEIEPSENITKLKINFINPSTNKIQVHIDYKVELKDNHGNTLFGPIPLTHTSTGSVTIPVELGSNEIGKTIVDVEGILFQPIEKATVIFDVNNKEDSENDVSVETDTEGKLTIEEDQDDLPESKPAVTKTMIPEWIKNVAEFWIANQIDDEGFVKVIEYLVKEEIIVIPYAEAPEGDAATQIPSWIKTNTEFWVTGDISDDEFVIGLEWLINNGVIRVQDAGGVSVSVYEIEGKYYPIVQFRLTPISPDCPDYHLHATSGYTVNAALASFTDHNPGACGLGTIDNIIQQQYIMTENQILEWEKVTGIKISAE